MGVRLLNLNTKRAAKSIVIPRVNLLSIGVEIFIPISFGSCHCAIYSSSLSAVGEGSMYIYYLYTSIYIYLSLYSFPGTLVSIEIDVKLKISSNRL